jgi:hypothetical protein
MRRPLSAPTAVKRTKTFTESNLKGERQRQAPLCENPSFYLCDPPVEHPGHGIPFLRDNSSSFQCTLTPHNLIAQLMTMHTPHRPHQAVSFSQAIDNSPSLAKLAEMARASSDMLKRVELLLPAALRASVKAGPIEGENWCLLVTGNAAAAKVRQMLPALQAQLQAEDHGIQNIRLKVLLAQKTGTT